MLSGDLLGERARLTPERLALVEVETGERSTYAELNRRSTLLARAWTERLGIRKGDRVALLSQNSSRFIEAFFAAGKTGAILVPLNTRLTAREHAAILADCRPRLLLFGEGCEAAAAEAAETAQVQGLKTLGLEDPSRSPGLAAAEFENVSCAPEDPYCLLYTSGTTGRPKGVILPHRMILWNGYNTALGWQLRADDVSPIFTPLYHAGGLGVFLVPLFTLGGTIVLLRGFDAAQVLRVLAAEHCTVVLGVPTIFKLLADAPEFATADLQTVRWFISGGAPLPLALLGRYRQRGLVLKQGYGLTEVGVNCFAMSEEESVAKAGSIGKPLPFTRARLVDESGREVAAGEVGELLLAGPHVASGYWGDPAATAAAFDNEGFFHTGDLARRDEEGFFYIVGRRKEMLISGGVNVYPAEIEAELLTHPQVSDAAVTGAPHETWGEVPVAFVVTAAGVRLSAEEILDYLAPRLARYKLPKAVVFLEALPRTAYGKVVKAELRELYLAPRKDS
ncbi:MAG TPA: long-chain fatty acid--CoA ligase [Thermoanaerobaculia bacterium]|nr:long-chain fatty acid--CoA ligase [Thermoanaerobaculia bacterium]